MTSIDSLRAQQEIRLIDELRKVVEGFASMPDRIVDTKSVGVLCKDFHVVITLTPS